MSDQFDDQAVLDAYPTAPIDHDNIEHYRAQLQRRLLVNRCAACSKFHAPPRSICPYCWSDDVVPTEVSGDGTIYLLTVLHIGAPSPDVDYVTGHPVGTVELPEQPGLRLTRSIVNCDPADLSIGTPVELAWIERGNGLVPAFQPAARAGT